MYRCWAVSALLCGMRLHFCLFFSGALSQGKWLYRVFISFSPGLISYLPLPLMLLSRKELYPWFWLLTSGSNIWFILSHAHSFWWIWPVGEKAVITVHGSKAQEFRNKRAGERSIYTKRWDMHQSKDSMPWIERSLKIEGASLGIHTTRLGRPPTLITINFRVWN